ncbi:zinc finger CCCH-type with G patch domain-containing protein [Cochliomyia hominivorax]
MEEYELQLLTVEQALLTTQDETARQELQTLKDSLIELIALTQVTEEENKKEKAKEDDDDDEMQRFMREINEISKDEKRDDKTKLQELRDKFEKMVGEKCSAPHKHTWGAVAYHNAIICGIEDEAYIDEDGNVDVKLRVLFTNPTHREMLPCNYYFEGNCRFDDANCHFSHGESIPAGELREYAVPDFSRLSRNCVVLAKLNDRLWHRGRVLCANFIEKLCRVRLDNREHKEREQDFNFEDLLPIFHDEDLSSGSSSDSDTESDDYPMTSSDTNGGFSNLFTYQLAQPLGNWEKHTRGIGSKLMAKMGYVYGTGLGSDGRGIITPVTAQILPPGRSLDHCMELREAANGDKDLFSVEKKLQKDQKKQEQLNAKAYERETQKSSVDVFSFINDTIFSTPKSTDIPKNKPSLQSHTAKSLNVESVRVADDIRRKEREIAEVEKSLKRNASGSQLHDHFKQKLQAKNAELNALQREEKSLSREQATRKTKEKLCVF